jgi:glycosyltransferase involved in cell wall biosynthesis
MKLTVFIGCFNEKPTILKAIAEAKALKLDKEIIVIDNCSTDGTRQILAGLKNDPGLTIVLHSRNMGAGYSAEEAISLAKGDYFYGPGADLEYTMSDVYKMIQELEKNNLDAILGSRILNRKGVSAWQLVKERPYWLGSIIATSLINFFYHQKFTDVIGINLVKTEILRKLKSQANSQVFTFELVSRLCKYHYRIGEVHLNYKPRTHKEGKTIRAIDMLPALWAMLRVKVWR